MTQPSAPGPIVLGRIDESFHQVAAAVVEEVLLRLGHHRRRERDGRRAVNLDGLDPLAAARQWMGRSPGTVRNWLG